MLSNLGSSSYSLITIMSNRQKGLMPNVKWILHDAFHSFCMKHMESNLKATFKDDYLVGLLWKAVFTYEHVEYKETKDKTGKQHIGHMPSFQ